jgi:pantoate kinase
MPVSEAICPAGISSFFEICNANSTGKALTDHAQIGARGGGFAIARGIRARVVARKASKAQITIRINSRPSPEAKTTLWALENLLKNTGSNLDVRVGLEVKVPIGAGYGTSAAGTLASCVALADAAQLQLSLNELGRLTHIAEIVNGTGLGTASALLFGGFVLVTEPGAPGIGLVDRLLFPEGHSILCAYLGPVSTRDALAQSALARKVNPPAQRAMQAIRKRPDLPTFLHEARIFSEQAGFQTSEITRLMETMMLAGAVGAAQNMIGKAVHGVVKDSKILHVLRAVRKVSPSATVFVSKLDNQGVRLLERRNPKH